MSESLVFWLFCSAFLLLGFVLGIYANNRKYHREIQRGLEVRSDKTFEEAHQDAVKAVKE